MNFASSHGELEMRTVIIRHGKVDFLCTIIMITTE